MERLLEFVLRRFVRRGALRYTTAKGSVFTVGDGTGTPVAVRFLTKSAEYGVLLDPEVKLGEAYMDGTFVVEQGTIADVLEILAIQTPDGAPPGWARIQWLLRFFKRRVAQLNRKEKSQKNVAHHYDLDGRLYSLFLDADRQYSCGYFESPHQSLDDAIDWSLRLLDDSERALLETAAVFRGPFDLAAAAAMLGYEGEQAKSQVHHLETGRREIRPAQRRLIEAYLSGYRPADWPIDE